VHGQQKPAPANADVARAPDVAALRDLAELVAAAARNPAIRERVGTAAAAPVTGASLVALRIVARRGHSTPSHVARHLGVDLSTASRQLRPLEDHGLLMRTPDPTDRRVAILTLTEEGAAVLRRIDDAICESFSGVLDRWPAEDRAALATLVARLHTDLTRSED
jgi:DNA-binding MarR family transcriptional regulator